MSADHDLERRIADFYATEAPARAPDRVLESALETIEDTRQRRVLAHLPWRFPLMPTSARLAIAAAAVVVAAVVGLSVFGQGTTPGPGSGGPTPSASPSPPASPSPSPSASPPALTKTYTSAFHGISVAHPGDWVVRPATEQWTSGIPFKGSEFADVIHDRLDDNIFLGMASQALAGRSGDRWADDVSKHPQWGEDCAQTLQTTDPVTIGGAPGRIVVNCPDGVLTAYAWTADRGYLIVLYPIQDRSWFKQILATIQLHPEDAVRASPSASP